MSVINLNPLAGNKGEEDKNTCVQGPLIPTVAPSEEQPTTSDNNKKPRKDSSNSKNEKPAMDDISAQDNTKNSGNNEIILLKMIKSISEINNFIFDKGDLTDEEIVAAAIMYLGGGNSSKKRKNINYNTKYEIFIDNITEPIDKDSVNFEEVTYYNFVEEKLSQIIKGYIDPDKRIFVSPKYKFTPDIIKESKHNNENTLIIESTIKFNFKSEDNNINLQKGLKLKDKEFKKVLLKVTHHSIFHSCKWVFNEDEEWKTLKVTLTLELLQEEVDHLVDLFIDPFKDIRTMRDTDIYKLFYKNETGEEKPLCYEVRASNYLNLILEKSAIEINTIIEKANKEPDNEKKKLYVYNELKKIEYDGKAYDYNRHLKNKDNIQYQMASLWQNALASKKATCYGYTSAFYYILHELKIEIGIVVSSKLNDHAWNYDNDGNWYDVTFDSADKKNEYYKIKNDKRFIKTYNKVIKDEVGKEVLEEITLIDNYTFIDEESIKEYYMKYPKDEEDKKIPKDDFKFYDKDFEEVKNINMKEKFKVK